MNKEHFLKIAQSEETANGLSFEIISDLIEKLDDKFAAGYLTYRFESVDDDDEAVNVINRCEDWSIWGK